MKKALVIIDLQIMPFIWKDYGGFPLHQEQELIGHVKHLIERARQAGAPVIFVMFTETGRSPRAAHQPLWQIHPELDPHPDDIRIIKYHADSFLETSLEQELRNREITDLVFCGVQTEYCIDTTLKRAYSLGFSCELAADAHSTFDNEMLSARQIIAHHNHILTQFCSIQEEQLISF